MAYEIRALSLSLATVVLTILALIIFIYQRGSSAFYAVAVIAIIVGFANAWLISRSTSGASVAPPSSSSGAKKSSRQRRKQ